MDTLKPGSLDVWGERDCNEKEFMDMRLALGDLSPEELKHMLEAYPQWTVQCESSDGQITKKYRRNLTDIPRKRFTRTGIDSTYLNTLFEPDMFDPAISAILGGEGTGSSLLGCFEVVSHDCDAAITASDILKIERAEQYLLDAGYLPQPQQDVV